VRSWAILPTVMVGRVSEVSSDAEWQAAWKETIEQRLRSIDDGTVELVDGDEVLAEMRALVSGKTAR
jgi:hypothetical protein